MEPLVTIGIPFYNGGEYIRYAIASCLRQSFESFELLLVNDGSTDDSVDIINSFADSRITLINDGLNKGLPARLNELIGRAKGQYFARMDADDIMHVSRIECQFNYLIAHPECDVVGCLAYHIDQDSKIVSKSKLHSHDPNTVSDILEGNRFIHPSVMGKTQWFRENPYDERLFRMQDLALWVNSVNHSSFHIMPDYLMYYRSFGTPTVSKYLSTQRYTRNFVTSIPDGLMTFRQKLKLFVYSYVKSVLYLLFAAFSMKNVFVSRHAIKLSDSEYLLASNDIEQSINF